MPALPRLSATRLDRSGALDADAPQAPLPPRAAPPGCARPRRQMVVGLALATGLGALGANAFAQTLKDPSVDDQIRTIPEQALLGRLQMGVFPEGSINGRPVRFSPAARILDRNNVAIVPSMVTAPVWVRYRTEPGGLVQTTWILTDDELASARRRR